MERQRKENVEGGDGGGAMTSFLQQGEEAEELGGMRAISGEGGGKFAGAGEGDGYGASVREIGRRSGVGGVAVSSKQGP